MNTHSEKVPEKTGAAANILSALRSNHKLGSEPGPVQLATPAHGNMQQIADGSAQVQHTAQLQHIIADASVHASGVAQLQSLANSPHAKQPGHKNLSGVINTVQMMLTDKTIGTYYDLTTQKEEFVQVYTGVLKKEHQDKGLPPNVVFKKGLGASADAVANKQLEGPEGIFRVITEGKDYFIREGYDDKNIHTHWEDLYKYADKLIDQAIQLSVHMLDKGVIDKDRKVYGAGMSGEITLRNLQITRDGGASIKFFDFEPIHTINWAVKKLNYNDLNAIELWLSTYTGICVTLAENLKRGSGGIAGMLKNAMATVLDKKGHGADLKKIGREDDDGGGSGGYVPPSFDNIEKAPEKNASAKVSEGYQPPNLMDMMPLVKENVEDHQPEERPRENLSEREYRRRGELSLIIFGKAEKYYNLSGDNEKFTELCALLEDWAKGFDVNKVMFSAMMRLMSGWKKELIEQGKYKP